MFDKISDLFSSGPELPDLIVVLDLEEWYVNLTDEQREKLHEHSTFFGTSGGSNLLEQDVVETSQSSQEYLKGVGATAANAKDYEFAEFVLLTALERNDGSVTSTHFTYNELIDVYYKQRDDREKCINYCKKDIKIAEEFVTEFGEVPRIPSFKRLAIIYEKRGQYDKAIAVCEQALDIGTTDGTQGGFEGRKERLLNKRAD